MRISPMKRIDQWAGGFGCFALDLADLLIAPLRPRPRPKEAVRLVLVTKYLGMGSIVLAGPMVAKLRELYPAARIVFLTFRENRDLARRLRLFDEVLTVDSGRLDRLGWDTARALVRLWRAGVDVVCDLEFFTRFSAMVAYLSGARTRVGYWSRIAWRGHLLTHPVYYNGTRHITRVFLAQAEALGATVSEEKPDLPALPPDPNAGASWRDALEAAGLDPRRPLLLVNPNASELCLERRWMPDRFAAAVDSLLTEYPDLVAGFVGSPGEAEYTQSVVGRCRVRSRVANLAGRLDLDQLVEALRGARLLLTNDSGPLHLASVVGTPTVSLFGPETPTLYGPLGARQEVFYAGVYCSPCLNVYNSKTATCRGNNICLQAFGVAQVVQACRRLLQPPAAEGAAAVAAGSWR